MLLPALLLATLTVSAPTPPAALGAAKVEALIRDGKLDEAIAGGRAGVLAHPDDVDLRLALARALSAKARRFDHVLHVAVTDDSLKKGEVTIPAKEADKAPIKISYDAGMFEEAIVHLDAGIKKAPAREDLRVLKCFLLTDAGRIDRARAAIENALGALPKTPKLAKTMIAYGVERAKRGDLQGGVRLMAPVAAAFPGDGNIQSDYGNALTRLGRKDDAYAALDLAVKDAPKDVRTARTRATSAMLLRDFPRARQSWDAVYRLTKLDGDNLASAAAAYAIDPKASVALFRDLSEPAPSGNSGVEQVAHLFDLAGTAGPGSVAAMSLAKSLVDAKQPVLAIPLLDAAIRAKPGDTEAKTLLAKVFRMLGCDALATGLD